MTRSKCIVWFASIFVLTGSAAGQAQFVAGTTPSQRPHNAPVITDISKPADWYRQALTGVEPPYPASLRFLENQEAWHTPFIHPGMTGPYDIRGWHQGALPLNSSN